jgi:hypothetical protein
MEHSPQVSNPFALLLNPEAVHAALQGSARLNGLKSRVWRPLDQPLIPRASTDVAEFDQAVDATPENDGEAA